MNLLIKITFRYSVGRRATESSFHTAKFTRFSLTAPLAAGLTIKFTRFAHRFPPTFIILISCLILAVPKFSARVFLSYEFLCSRRQLIN